MVGPVVKIDERTLPTAPNIRYLGLKAYDELPCYLAGWDVALMPFARNEATRFISPTKTPEYLAAGRRVVSTSIADVVEPYGRERLVAIADEPESFISACAEAIERPHPGWLHAVDRFLGDLSWDWTWEAMNELLTDAVERRAGEAADVVRSHGAMRYIRPAR